jgi:hypothetical protein
LGEHLHGGDHRAHRRQPYLRWAYDKYDNSVKPALGEAGSW